MYKKINPLQKYSKNITSQYGEDGIIEQIFNFLPIQKDYWCVEFGAGDGVYLSNTYNLITNKGWNGLLIEGNSQKFPSLESTYESNHKVHLLNKEVQYDGKNTLNNIFKNTPIPLKFDLLSIDVDGIDYHLWESLKNYKPKVIIIEFNPSIPSDISFVQSKDFNVNHGNSLNSIITLGKDKGYELIATTSSNGIFLDKEYFSLFNISNNSIENMWNTKPTPPRIFQLYDGTIVLSEDFKLIWHDTKVGRYDLQKLPRSERVFGDRISTKPSMGFLKKLFSKFITSNT